MNRKLKLLLTGAYAFVVLATLPTVAGLNLVGAAHPAHTPTQRPIYEDTVLNYDFKGGGNYDWPVDLFFTNGATKPYVRSVFKPAFPMKLSPDRPISVPDWIANIAKSPSELCGETYEEHWCDEDRGMKDYACGSRHGEPAYHVRIYGAPFDWIGARADSAYTEKWGYYVIGTSHKDYNECDWPGFRFANGPKHFGWSESVEDWVAYSASNLSRGIRDIRQDSIRMANAEPFRKDGNHYWQNDGLATRIMMKGGATASSAPPGTNANPYPTGALTRYYDYQNGGGSGDHWTTTGPAPAYYSNEGVLGFVENQQVGGTAPLYECSVNTWDHFLSRDSSCAPGVREGIAGYVYTSQPSQQAFLLRSCSIGNEIYESNIANCEGFTQRGQLGWILAAGKLRRYVGGGVDHHVTTGRGPAGSLLENIPLGSLIANFVPVPPDANALYSCRNKSIPRDHFLSLQRNCEGNVYLGLEGYTYKSSPPGVPTIQIYRCLYPGGHFVSNSSSCEGWTLEYSLGYATNP